ncbi:MAG: DinB family protein [Bacteroidota bacterium]
MPTQAQDYANLHIQSQARIHALADGAAGGALVVRPAPGAWSAAECVEHLNRVAEGYLGVIEPAVAADARRAEGPFAYGFVMRKMISGMEGSGPALKTPQALNPAAKGGAPDLDPAAALVAFDGYVARYIAACRRAEGLDLRRIKVRYPFGPLLRLPLGAALQLSGLHALRHVAQAERAVAHATG